MYLYVLYVIFYHALGNWNDTTKIRKSQKIFIVFVKKVIFKSILYGITKNMENNLN